MSWHMLWAACFPFSSQPLLTFFLRSLFNGHPLILSRKSVVIWQETPQVPALSPSLLLALQLISFSTWLCHVSWLSQEEASYLPLRAPLPPVFSNPTSPHSHTSLTSIIITFLSLFLSSLILLLLPILFHFFIEV